MSNKVICLPLSCVVLALAGCNCPQPSDPTQPSNTPPSSCDADGDGKLAIECGGTDCNDHQPIDLAPTSCAVDLIGYVNQLITTVNALPQPLSSRTSADLLGCPADIGVGEETPNYFSFVGPLNKDCNLIHSTDDCADPQRSNYWVSVLYSPDPDPYYFRVIWGDDVVDYRFYGACSPDPNGFDNSASGIPKLLVAVNDANGDGVLGVPGTPGHCPLQNHVYKLQFYTIDASGMKSYIERSNIQEISAPFIADPSVDLGLASTAYQSPGSSGYVAVLVSLKQPAESVMAYVESNYDEPNPKNVAYMGWKEPATCSP